MPGSFTRIFSDVHFGDRASHVDRLGAIAPLFDGAERVVVNGDLLDTRRGPFASRTARLRADVEDFLRHAAAPAVLLTGNHDPDIAERHELALSAGRVVATHGDVVFDDIVPWSRDAPLIRARIAAALGPEASPTSVPLARRFEIWRQVAASIPQRHQAEPNPLKHFVEHALETFWPPTRLLRILRVWRRQPETVAQFAARHWPDARVLIVGHTHRPGAWRARSGLLVINTGSFCPPLGACVADVHETEVAVRAIERRRGEFRVGETLHRFPLAL